jgi:hypothetical protein
VKKLKTLNNRHSKMPFWRYTDNTICEVKRQKASEPSAEKIPEKGNAKVPAKGNLTIMKRSSYPEVSSINQPSTSGQKNVVD